ncbi:YdeI/OmpD-associated family protein [Mitsuaria sp. GD03876]|uniref:YdeI/OmpD-associated family protein n=1 Tax=Mitsuaria sp. GD03876 TaxID=2975399 RepID=UPI00244D00F3|nr:YdeI/OmpD-associated family protein [Mitsuaria sp. GD03876]MDH0866377.1 YdeI/OmpD-associated family protein [Mitsuaria sp. GD03876]
MPTLDPRVDAYIDRAAPFAQDLLRHWRATVHAHCPDVVETIKWGFPNFTYRDKILTGMAAFKAHCSIGFWHGQAAVGADHAKDGAMGDFGRLTSLKDLPSKAEQKAILKRAMTLIEDGVKARPARPATPKPPPEVPEDLAAALRANAAARKTFEGFPPSHRREYIEWIVEAKKAETRERRLAQTVEWLAEGKPRNWKYQNC